MKRSKKSNDKSVSDSNPKHSKRFKSCEEETVNDLLEPMPQKVDKSSIELYFLRKFKKDFKQMTRNDLEELILQKVVEAIINKSEISELRQKTEAQEHAIQYFQATTSKLAKQCNDLKMIQKTVISDLQAKIASFVVPVKIQQHVGIQVPHSPKSTQCSIQVANVAPQKRSIVTLSDHEKVSKKPGHQESVPAQTPIVHVSPRTKPTLTKHKVNNILPICSNATMSPRFRNQTNPTWKRIPPRPIIRVNSVAAGIVITWSMDELTNAHSTIIEYEIYVYTVHHQNPIAIPPMTSSNWVHFGNVKSMLLPMAVTLTDFEDSQRYYFCVRAVDEHLRCGLFSTARTWNEDQI